MVTRQGRAFRLVAGYADACNLFDTPELTCKFYVPRQLW
jgi:hypothetical protein